MTWISIPVSQPSLARQSPCLSLLAAANHRWTLSSNFDPSPAALTACSPGTGVLSAVRAVALPAGEAAPTASAAGAAACS
eukprot:6457682-Pyramimonas_sp.AAC.1